MILVKPLKTTSALLAVLGLSALNSLSAQSVTSRIVGAMALTVPASSDIYVTPTFATSAVFRGEATAAAAGSVTFTGSSLGDYSEGHSIIIESGTLEGRVFAITANTATVLTLADPDSELAAANGERVAIVPDLTLGTLFPEGLGGVEEASIGNPDVILFPNDNSQGVEGFFPKAFYYYGIFEDVAAWRKVGQPLGTSFDDEPLPLGQGIVVRNNSAEDVRFYVFGEVLTSKFQIPVVSKKDKTNDNLLGVPRPLPIPLGELGLTGAGGVFDATTDSASPTDTLLVYLNDGTGKNVAPDATYFFFNNAWRLVGDGDLASRDNVEIPATAALVLRKAASTVDSVVYWTNDWTLPSES